MKDLYSILGIEKTAGPEEIKRAYRKLASKHHPDRGGDTAQFQEIQSAYETLSDPQRRQQYDNPSPFASNFNNGGFRGHFNDAQFDLNSIFDMFGARFHQQRSQYARVSLWLTLEEVYAGGKKTIGIGTPQGQHAVEVDIPKGVEDGMGVQYSGIAPGGLDLVVQYRIHPHLVWVREKNNLLSEKKLNFWELILGKEITVQAISGQMLNLKIPPNTQPGTTMRLRGLGLLSMNGHQGDALVKIQGVIPADIPDYVMDAIRKSQGQ
jgi:DnaJ-class molecular chaperone